MLSPIFGVVLAAGASSRMGSLKQLLRVDDETFVERAVRTLREGGAERVYVVLGAHADEVAAALPPSVRAVHNTAWANGQYSSARLGLKAALDEGAGTIILSLVDHPELRPETVRALLLRDDACAVPGVAGARGHPLCLSADAARRVLAEETAVSLKEALWRARVIAQVVSCEDTGALGNMNTRADLPTSIGERDRS